MRYCARCIQPETRPGIAIDEAGICSACRGDDDKRTRIDWAARGKAFDAIVAEARDRATSYDCVVPVSGGKDSWYQVIRAQQAGLKVLAITWRTPGRTAIGQANLDSLIAKLGVDHIDYSIAPDTERRFMIAAYERKGATAIPMHMALFAIPIRLAVQQRIPLVIWGENPQLEFGGKEADRLATELDLAWIKHHGVTNNTSLEDWIGAEGLTARDLIAYRLPEQADFAAFAPKSIFLGSYFRWNSFENAEIAKSAGFKSGSEHLKTGSWDFADIDCDFIALHHFLKWYKFGCNRSFDNLSVQIRYGMITRDEAIAALRQIGPSIPTADINKFCAFVGKPKSWFWETAESFRNKSIWTKEQGKWIIRDFIVPDWPWSAS